MIIHIRKELENKTFHWVERPGVPHRYEDTKDAQGNPTGLGSITITVPRTDDESVPEDFRKIFHAIFTPVGVDRFTVEWMTPFIIRLTVPTGDKRTSGGIEFNLESNKVTGPWRKVFGRQITPTGDTAAPFQIRTSWLARKREISFICEHRPEKSGKQVDLGAPLCEKCGEALERAAVPNNVVANEKQKYWKCATDGCDFTLEDPPFGVVKPPEFKDDYATKTDNDLDTLCAERSIQRMHKGKKMDRAEMIAALRKFDGDNGLAGVAA